MLCQGSLRISWFSPKSKARKQQTFVGMLLSRSNRKLEHSEKNKILRARRTNSWLDLHLAAYRNRNWSTIMPVGGDGEPSHHYYPLHDSFLPVVCPSDFHLSHTWRKQALSDVPFHLFLVDFVVCHTRSSSSIEGTGKSSVVRCGPINQRVIHKSFQESQQCLTTLLQNLQHFLTRQTEYSLKSKQHYYRKLNYTNLSLEKPHPLILT